MTDTTNASEPKGVTVVLINRDGRVVSSASSFEPGASVGSTEKREQRQRAEHDCYESFVRAAVNSDVFAVLPHYERAGIVRDLCDQQGYRQHVIWHGWAGDGSR